MASHFAALTGASLGHRAPIPAGKRGTGAMANRKRNRAITLRMTDDELKIFQNQFKKSEAKNQTDFVLRLLDEKPITVNYELVSVLAELKRQGNNLNQVAKLLHAGTPFGEPAKKVLNQCWIAYKKIQEMK